ncbi:hypothetical protein QUB05_07935 [Microcoleus sp. F10-C6]|uniref:hypothetical protein n=1 Tax=unclassified Microcoleus TaxID=2642155 RepID=UPI002FD0B18D
MMSYKTLFGGFDGMGDGVGPSPVLRQNLLQFLQKIDCDRFNCLWDTNDPLLHLSLLFLPSGRSGSFNFCRVV